MKRVLLPLAFFLFACDNSDVVQESKKTTAPVAPPAITTPVVTEETKSLDLPLKCTDNPDDWGVAQKHTSSEIKEAFDLIEKNSLQQWSELKVLISSKAFKARGMSSEKYKTWAQGNDSLSRMLESHLKLEDVNDTDYYECRNALVYSIAFQSDYARGVALNTRVKHYESEVEKQFKLLRKR